MNMEMIMNLEIEHLSYEELNCVLAGLAENQPRVCSLEHDTRDTIIE